MRTQSNVWTVGFAGIALAAALALVLSLQLREPSVARSAQVAVQHDATQQTRIVPADVLGTSAPWAPLTGDGSN